MSESNSSSAGHLRPFKKRLIELKRVSSTSSASMPGSPVVVPTRKLTSANASPDVIVQSEHTSRPYSAPSVCVPESPFEPVPSPTITMSDVAIVCPEAAVHLEPKQRAPRTMVPRIQMPAAENKDDQKKSGDTPRSGVRVSIAAAETSETTDDDDDDSSSGDEQCIYSSASIALTLESIRKSNRTQTRLQGCSVTNDDVPDVRVSTEQQQQPKTRSQRKMSKTSYLEFVIRPLTLGDYGPALIHFLSKVVAFEAAASSSPPRSVRSSLTPLLLSSNETTASDAGFLYFTNLMMERKRTKHFTLIAAVSDETTKIIALGSIFFTYKVGSVLAHQDPPAAGSAKKKTKTKGTVGYIDEILVDPFYQTTQLYEKMLYRLIEIAEMMKDVSHVVVCCDEHFISLSSLLTKVHACENMGQTYKIALRK